MGHVKTGWGTGWRIVAEPSRGLDLGFFRIDILAVWISKHEWVRGRGHIARSRHSPVVANGGNASLLKGGGVETGAKRPVRRTGLTSHQTSPDHAYQRSDAGERSRSDPDDPVALISSH